ncbi:AfsR/SARP family transcriptional regulator [Kitasatospora kifunensis]|uniref:DNA-binding SARP family transcriptional activator n=1 Tax=Kitasatospora kifunensis TaxID=58351 RepID=A0A7W7VVX3_KITKI|nr:AfsR/SARP family transcriptional regulator [Kitasatospora kifunensis]MBB4924856.1 DNA-binding SARP family transcriptional activator [Kitasatospora kifunensis]
MIADIRLLGPLRATISDVDVLPAAAKPRQVLALLAVRAGQIVTVAALTEELWGERPPRSAVTTLQTYVLQLRRRIATALGGQSGAAAKELLATVHGGYRLLVPAEEVDLHRARTLIERGRRALAVGEDQAGGRLLHQALALWDGPMLVDVPKGRQLGIECLSLAEVRLGALELRIEADLRLGRHAELLAELTVLTAEQPLHEVLHAQHMLALHRSGRSVAALEVFRRLRARLVGETGLEPSSRVQRLHQAILAGHPGLETVPVQRLLAADLSGA